MEGERPLTQFTYRTHLAPVWREKADFIINASIADDESNLEQLWTRRLDSERLEICCIPFYLYGVALGDVVSFTVDDERGLLLDEKLEESGRYVLRAYLRADRVVVQRDLYDRLCELGTLQEWSGSRFVAIDCRDEPHAARVSGYLQQCVDLNLLEYETGR